VTGATADRAAAWIYRGIWAVLVSLFRVPQEPPTLPGVGVSTFQPSAGFLRILKLKFWIALLAVDVLILVGWIAITVVSWPVGVALAIPALLLAVVPDVIAYIAIHLRYDTTWYVMSERSIRIRRGVWVLRETTITFENVQNVKVLQGPVERFFGIGNVVIETAGGSGGSGHGNGHMQGAHVGVIEGIADAPRVRDLILAQVRESTTAGLGDEEHATTRHGEASISPALSWSGDHVAVLREIRHLLASA
jgi:membrane protein YdbS with pleckstrin-like domain